MLVDSRLFQTWQNKGQQKKNLKIKTYFCSVVLH